ncbi:ArsR/SmtB family transcription factor [Janibacter alittae]|uniref:Metalloregulator ArsR/SmtB family transcription factor n=1 Tax=Janibacter alittae TaxID=3115209 RepID=A0ABZ2MEU8_9MICO
MTSSAHHPAGQPLAADRVAAARDRLPELEATERLAGVLGLLADPTRLRIVYALDVAEELCVGDIAIALGASADSTGYALRVLRTAGLVSRRKAGRVAYYRLADGFPEPLRQHCLLQLIDLTRHGT